MEDVKWNVEKEVKFIIKEVEKNVDCIINEVLFKFCKIVMDIEEMKK